MCLTVSFVYKRNPLISTQAGGHPGCRPSGLQTLGSLFQVSREEKMRLSAEDEAEDLQRRGCWPTVLAVRMSRN